MSYEFHPAARTELRKAVAFYEKCEQGLGAAFVREVDDVLRKILDSPYRWPSAGKGTRRCLARRFPYGILYSINAEKILVVAVMHCSRRPDYWLSRMGKEDRN